MKATITTVLSTALFLTAFSLFFDKFLMKYVDHGLQQLRARPSTMEQERLFLKCKLGGEDDCFEKFSIHLRHKSSWHFFGDSQMIRTFGKIRYPRKVTGDKYSSNRCGFLEYANIPQKKMWAPPNHSLLQGPCRNGLENPFCSDLSGTLYRMTSENRTHFIEFVTVEFANDVEQQSKYGKTTQETVSKYLSRQIKERRIPRQQSVCVANTGIHDQQLCGDLKMEEQCRDLYLLNVRNYLKHLSRACGNIVWVTLTHVAEIGGYVQQNSRAKSWNAGVESLLQNMTVSSNFFFLDIFNFSSQANHTDNVHFNDTYYEAMGSFFSQFLK